MYYRTIAVLLVTALLASAQIGDSRFMPYGLISVPVGDYADDGAYNTDGFATFGVGGGVQYGLQLGVEWLWWVNDLTVSVDFFEEDETFSISSLPFEADEGGHYIQVPVVTGVGITTASFGPLRAYGSAQAGAALLAVTELEAKILSFSEVTLESEPTVTFAAVFGGGLAFDFGLTLGVRYSILGEPEIDYTVNDDIEGEREFSIGALHLIAGFAF